MFMTKPVHLTAMTLEDTIVLDGVKAINILKEERKLKGRIAGGMAVQGYTPKELHRETIDLDYALSWNGSATEYRELCVPLVDFLRNQGYDVSFMKKGLAYEFIYKKENGGGSFMIQHPHRSNNHLGRIQHTLDREFENQRIVSKNDLSFDALSPEDIIVTKLNRALIFSDRYGLAIPQEKTLSSLKETSTKLRAEIISRTPEVSPRDVALLRLVNDMYDIKCLTDTVGINKKYFEEVLEDWGRIDRDFFTFLSQMEVSVL